MKIAVSSGDYNGIGIEIFFKGLYNYKIKDKNEIKFNLYCNKSIFKNYILNCKGLPKFNFDVKSENFLINGFQVTLNHISTNGKINFSKLTKTAGEHSLASIFAASESLLNKTNDALITLPLSKEAIYLAGTKFPGQTELLAEKCSIDNPLMILFTNNIRVALATIHIPVSKISKLLDKQGIYKSAKQFYISLKKDFGIEKPKIAVLGLNPHAGENGSIGNEEIKKIIPAISKMKNKGIEAFGPFPADGFFAHKEYLKYDGILAMYHDQGLIPLKMLGNGGGVNFTAGLPMIRTSPDHGTAFNIAGKGIANPQSFIDALNGAREIYRNRTKFNN